MYQIQFGFLKSKGKYICLLDGDDKFSNLKLNNLSKKLGQTKTTIIQDVPILFSRKDRAKNQNIDHTETVDIAPTILNLLDIKTNHAFDGKVLPVQ